MCVQNIMGIHPVVVETFQPHGGDRAGVRGHRNL